MRTIKPFTSRDLSTESAQQQLFELSCRYAGAKNILILHHDDMDGFAAGAAALSYFQHTQRVESDYIKTVPVRYAPKEELKAKFLEVTQESDKDTAVFILDFSYDRETLDWFTDPANQRCRSLTVLDHHKTAEEQLHGASYAIFDMARSGAMLAFNYFFPYLEKSRYPLLTAVDNRDLWKTPFTNEQNVHQFLLLTRSNSGKGFMKEMQRLIFDTDLKAFDDIVTQGAALLDKTHCNVKSVLRGQINTRLNGEECLVVFSGIDQAEIAEALYMQPGKQHVVAAVVSMREDVAIFSLRSHKEHGPDVSKIAALLGGGGHANAAGFTCHPRKACELIYGQGA